MLLTEPVREKLLLLLKENKIATEYIVPDQT
jgi:hypothetical protein